MCSFGPPTFLENLFVRLIFPFETLSGSSLLYLLFVSFHSDQLLYLLFVSFHSDHLLLADLLAFCEFSFGADIISHFGSRGCSRERGGCYGAERSLSN